MEESKNQYNIGVKKNVKPDSKLGLIAIKEDGENDSFDLNSMLNGPSFN